MEMNELRQDVKENIGLINKILRNANKMGMRESTYEVVKKIGEIRKYYIQLLDMLKKDKNILPDRQNCYQLIYKLTSDALVVLLPILKNVVNKKTGGENDEGESLEESENNDVYNELLDSVKDLILLTKQTSNIEYIKLIDDSVKKINTLSKKTNRMNLIVKKRWNTTVPIDKYMSDLSVQKNYLMIIKNKIKDKSLDQYECAYAISLINSYYKLIMECISKTLDCSLCQMKGIQMYVEMPDETLYNTYKQTIDEFMGNLNNKEKIK